MGLLAIDLAVHVLTPNLLAWSS